MANLLQQAGAASEPSSFAPLHTNRIFTGLWTNRNVLRDAATSDYQERYGMGRQDSILTGHNSEITPRLTLRRRAGSSIYNPSAVPPLNRFYSFNTFSLTTEVIRVMADSASTVYDATAPGLTPIHNKASGAGPTFFLGVGNILYFTDGIDNKQWNYGTNQVWNWGMTAPTAAPDVYQSVQPNPYSAWRPNTVFFAASGPGELWIKDPNGNMQTPAAGVEGGTTGSSEPAWATSGNTADGSVTWRNAGSATWQPGTTYGVSSGISVAVNTASGTVQMTFKAQNNFGVTGASQPNWPSGIGLMVQDGGVQWQNVGLTLNWATGIGPNTVIADTSIVDPNGYFQGVYQAGKSGPAVPPFATALGALTQDNNLVWKNTGPFAPAGSAPVRYGYAFKNSVTKDISSMSPATANVTFLQGNWITLRGNGSTDSQADKIIIYRTAQGGSTFLFLDEIANTGATQWQYVDHAPDSDLNPQIQAQVAGEGTPLPAGATCLGYHVGRIFAAVGNVVYVSSGPDAIVSTSSGNAGFNTTFTAQSKITRFWTCSLGMVVFTVRDAYIILGTGTPSDPLYMVTFIEQIPLLHYDAFTVNKTTPMLMQGNNMVIALDPSAGIVEIGFPIADRFEEEFDPSAAFVTYHSESSRESALYVANGNGYWYRMNQNNAPEQGSAWSTRANIAGMGCVQSVEVTPGVFRLLYSGNTTGPIMQRDVNARTDNGAAYPVSTVFGSIVMAQPGQLAAISFITLESVRVGTRAGLALLLGEISGPFEELNRTRQDPTNLPPSTTLFSDRYHFAQNQQTAWCRHFQMEISWPPEDAANELLTFTIFGQTWQEMRSQ